MSTFCFNEDYYINRQNKFLNQIKSSQTEATLIFGYGSALGAGSKSHGAMRYLTGWDSHEAFSVLLLSKDIRLVLISSPFMLPAAREKYSNIQVAYIPSNLWCSTLSNELKSKTRLGLIGFDEIPAGVYRSLLPVLDSRTTICLDEQLSLMRMLKDETEIALHREGAAICDSLFAKLVNEFNPKQPIWQTQLSLENQARLQGADYCKTWLTIRPGADYPRYWPEEGERIPELGDQVLFGIALSVQGHWAHGIRMGSLGPPKSLHQQLWTLVMQMMSAASQTLKPGQSMGLSDRAMSDIFSQYTKEHQLSKVTRFRNGHALGTSYEDPIVTDYFPQYFASQAQHQAQTAALTVQSSMLLELHPNIFLAESGGAAIGEMVLISENGPENLLTFPAKLFEL